MNTDERKVLTVCGAPGVDRNDDHPKPGGVGYGNGMSVHIKGLTVLTEETAEGSRHNLFQGSFADNRISSRISCRPSIRVRMGSSSGHQRLAKPVTEWTLGC